ncbi:hypothetical protein LOD99_3620 [Oopsacas minuta]|uniref:Uncharacterized protein n=1 Tax=Oopsacas minuta TaxID=111878 RepID=A0AAV7JXH8_9METZ|nr:hypothetical protein LOD99_3620 [Oopsacas minuta]
MGYGNSKVANKPHSQQTHLIVHTLAQENIEQVNKQCDEVEPKSKPIQVCNEYNENIEDVELKNTELDSYFVRQAFGQFLPKYHVVIISGNKIDEEIPTSRNVVMQVLRDPEVILTPDPTAKYLSYGKTETRYTLYLARKNDDLSNLKFLYHWNTSGDTFVSSPYFDQNPQVDKRIKCDIKSIKYALLGEHPISAIVKVLETIKSDRKGENNGLDGPDFLWLQEGRDENFSISIPDKPIPDKPMFWKDIKDKKISKEPKPPVKLTKNQAKMLHLRFRD